MLTMILFLIFFLMIWLIYHTVFHENEKQYLINDTVVVMLIFIGALFVGFQSGKDYQSYLQAADLYPRPVHKLEEQKDGSMQWKIHYFKSAEDKQ